MGGLSVGSAVSCCMQEAYSKAETGCLSCKKHALYKNINKHNITTNIFLLLKASTSKTT